MSRIGGVLGALVILLAMVTIHEFGHYIAGKALGFKITEFAVGFGPAILKKRSKKTGEKFSLRVIPLGGFCAFDGEDDGDDAYGGYYENLKKKKAQEEGVETPSSPDETTKQEGTPDETTKQERVPKEKTHESPVQGINAQEKAEIDSLFSAVEETPEEESLTHERAKEENYPEPQGARFTDQAPWKRIIVLIAGALMNYLLALVLSILLIGIYGAPRYEISVQDTTKQDATTITEDAFLVNEGDTYTIVAIDGKRLYLSSDYQLAVNGKKAGDEIVVTLIKAGETQPVDKQITLSRDINFANMSDATTILRALNVPIGTTCSLRTVYVRQGFFETIGSSFEYSFKLGGTVLRSLGELLTGKLGVDAMGGPVTTIGATAQAATNGFASFLNIAVLIGVNLAVFNLLPVPALDGCKIIFCIIEWIRKKPVNRKVEAIIHFAGVILIFGFAIFVDIFHLF
ncbi:MAG: site-2 protease family protein [Clostridia bacterium]|nr:site-2 protease family protein [Clostridia bacterium]